MMQKRPDLKHKIWENKSVLSCLAFKVMKVRLFCVLFIFLRPWRWVKVIKALHMWSCLHNLCTTIIWCLNWIRTNWCEYNNFLSLNFSHHSVTVALKLRQVRLNWFEHTNSTESTNLHSLDRLRKCTPEAFPHTAVQTGTDHCHCIIFCTNPTVKKWYFSAFLPNKWHYNHLLQHDTQQEN